jgi:hypothetical protein
VSVDYVETASGLLLPSNVRGLKFGTPRDPSRPTIGGLQAAFSSIWLGRSLMPHQRYIADVCGEVLPSGLPAYTLCLITFQRQGGKSALAMAQTGERCFTRPGFHAWYTAQKRKDARDQFLSFADDVVDGTPLGRVLAPLHDGKVALRGNGTELMRFPRASWLRPHEPSEESLHGKQSDRNDIDEAWAFSKEHGEALIQAIGPTQVTRPGAQTFIWSAGGTAASTWLAALVDRGRALVGGGLNAAALEAPRDTPLHGQRMAFFELGIPDDADPEDLEVVAEHHPAYGYTVTMDSLAALRTTFGDDVSGWARAGGNRWTEVIGGSISAAAWEANRHPDPIPDNGEPLGWGTARAEDGSMTAIACATYVDLDEGRVIVAEVVEVMDGAYRAAEVVRGWVGRDAVAIDPSGPSATIAEALDEDLDDEHLIKVTARDYSAACANVLDALDPRAKAYRYRPNVHLDNAVRVVGKRNVGDGGFVWGRLTSGAPTAPLEAVTLAIWALTHRPADGKAAIEWA